MVVDPRAGHGPGIGGFKADSEIGVALRARHPCYFVGFLPEPVPGQTIEDILHAEATFLETVIARHPDAEGKPCVIGNCQAGWAMMMVNAVRPELFGPIIVAGSPLSYWAGVRGQFPMRYSGGLLGGSWLTALTSDLGAGVFDGAWLVQNFENQNPANTLWSKQYNLYANVDTEAERYLEFEKWWGGHVDLNAEEIQFIVDELFVGNRLASGDIRLSDGTAIDLRNIRAPIVVFCSKADNITPPQQALDWILDLYDDVDDIRRNGQTIVYTIHETAGHLGIFVSGSVARKEHDEFASNIDLIDTLPPGLYEAVLEPREAAGAGNGLVGGDWIMRCEPRTLDDIRAMGGNDPEDERRFATAARLSEINLALYRTFAQPYIRAAITPVAAEALRKVQPLRLSYAMMGRGTPMGAWLSSTAAMVEENRKAVSPDNPFLAMQEMMSRQIVEGLETFRKSSERLAEQTFHAVYGNPVLQTAMGIDTASDRPPRKAARSLMHEALVDTAHRGTARRHDRGRPARGDGAGPVPCGRAARRRGRAQLRGDPPLPRDACRGAVPAAARVQAAPAGAVPHAADRRGGGARRHPGPPSRGRGRASGGLRGPDGGADRARPPRRGGSGADGACRAAIWSRRRRVRYRRRQAGPQGGGRTDAGMRARAA